MTRTREDQRIIEHLRQGDNAAFEQLIREHGGYLMSITRRYLKSEADVQDSVQDTFMQAFRAAARFEGRASVRSWLHRIAVNAALMKIRTQSRRQEDAIDDTASLFDENGKRLVAEPEIHRSVEQEILDKESREMVRNHIETLPGVYRNLLLLRDIEGYSTSETAELLGVSIASVKTGLHRARKSLKQRILQEQL